MLLATSADAVAFGAAGVGLLTLLATIAAPLLSARRERPKRALAYEANVFPLAVAQPKEMTPIVMSIGDRTVDDPCLVTLRLRNSGNTPILPTDFDGPIEVVFEDSGALLEVNLDEAEPSHLAPLITTDEQTVLIEPLLLNPRDGFVLTMLSDRATEPMVRARIAGIAQPSRESTTFERRRRKRSRELRTVLVMLVFVLVGYLALGVAVFSLFKEASQLRPGDARDPLVSGCARTSEQVPGTAVALVGRGLRFGTLTLQHSPACNTAWGKVHGLSRDQRLRLVIIANRPSDHATTSYALFSNFAEVVYGNELLDNHGCVRAIAVIEHRHEVLARAQTPCR